MLPLPSGHPGPLAGLRVLDFSHWLAGPYCTNMLSDLGADVIKVEPPQGDPTRNTGSLKVGDESALFLIYNHGKRSIALDLRRPEDLEAARRLAERSDVVVENFRPGTADRLGIGYQELARRNPRLVYCSVSAFGEDGPYRDRPGMDPIVQAMGGVMSVTGEPGGPPLLSGVPVADIVGALLAAQGTLAALLERERSGQGQRVTISLIDGVIFSLSTRVAAYWFGGQMPRAYGNAHSEMVPYQAFPTADGWIVAGAQGDAQWPGFCRAIGRPDLETDPHYSTNALRVENREELTVTLNEVFRHRLSAYWLELFAERKLLCGPVWTVKDALESDLVRDHGVVQMTQHSVCGPVPVLATPIGFSRTSGRVQGPAPVLGEHTQEILAELSAPLTGRS